VPSSQAVGPNASRGLISAQMDSDRAQRACMAGRLGLVTVLRPLRSFLGIRAGTRWRS